MTDVDPSLRRVERDAAIACGVMALAAILLQRGNPSGALGVLGGGAIMAVSYRAIRGGVDAMVARVLPQAGRAPAPARTPVWPILKFLLRYAIIGAAAWILLVTLHAHPVGVVAGVTAPVVALTLEAWRHQRRRRAGSGGSRG
jgi:hypothetical protein